jgi:hypothetical protein
MHCDAFILVLGHNVDEFLDYFVTWARAIRKLKVENPDSLSFKNACIVQTLVQSAMGIAEIRCSMAKHTLRFAMGSPMNILSLQVQRNGRSKPIDAVLRSQDHAHSRRS